MSFLLFISCDSCPISIRGSSPGAAPAERPGTSYKCLQLSQVLWYTAISEKWPCFRSRLHSPAEKKENDSSWRRVEGPSEHQAGALHTGDTGAFLSVSFLSTPFKLFQRRDYTLILQNYRSRRWDIDWGNEIIYWGLERIYTRPLIPWDNTGY